MFRYLLYISIGLNGILAFTKAGAVGLESSATVKTTASSWKWSVYSRASGSVSGVFEGAGVVSNYTAIKAKQFVENASWSIVPAFEFSTAGQGHNKFQEQRLGLKDMYFEYQRKNLGIFRADVRYGLRTYFPLSFTSKRNRLLTKAGGYASSSWSITPHLKGYYRGDLYSYLYNGRTYTKKLRKQQIADGVSNIFGKKLWSTKHSMILTYSVSSVWAVNAALDQSVNFYKRTENTERSRSYTDISLGSEFEGQDVLGGFGLSSPIYFDRRFAKAFSKDQSTLYAELSVYL